METLTVNSSFGSHFSQVAWVVKDIQAAEKIFNEVFGIRNFVKLENLNAQELEGTYYGKPADFVFHLYMAYSGESLIELIQPVSGQSMYQDYLEKYTYGGLQHIAFIVPVADLDKAIAELTNKGYAMITSLNLPIAKVAYFDTYKEIGVVTEIIGATDAGLQFVEQLKSGTT
jgi:methylmalonyl-CoA/ethylmalonyl-CoA epimerase